jgi:hypothetical protein
LKDIRLKYNQSTSPKQEFLCDPIKMDLVHENNVTRSQEDTPNIIYPLNTNDDKEDTVQSTSNDTGTKLDFSETDPGLRGSRSLDLANKSGIHLNEETKIYISGQNLLEHSPPGKKDKSGLRSMQRSKKNKNGQFEPKNLPADKSYEKKRSQSKDYRISNGSICISHEGKHSAHSKGDGFSGINSKLHNPHENTKSIIDTKLTFSRRGQDLPALGLLESSEDANNPSKTNAKISIQSPLAKPSYTNSQNYPAPLNPNPSSKFVPRNPSTILDPPSAPAPQSPYDVDLQDLVANKVFRKYDRRLQKNFDVDPADQLKIHKAFSSFRHRLQIKANPTPATQPINGEPGGITHQEIIRIVTTKQGGK